MSNVVIITEDMNREINDLLAMTQFKFKANIRKFLAALLEDPTGAEPGAIFTHNGLDKNKLIKALVDNKVITKKMTIDDHDENGNPHTAKMIVKYSVPKERFNERLDALYDVLFPNVDAKINESLFETDPYEDSLKIIKNSPLTMGVISGGVNRKLSPEYGMGKFFDDAAKALNKKIEDKKLDEEGGGATSCSGVDGNGFGSGEFTVPAFGKVIRQKKKEVGGNPYTLTEKVVRISEAQAKLITEAVTGKDAEKAAAIYAYCLDDKEEDYCILCAKRLEGDEKGKWNPPMGHLHVDESPKDGAVRECEEESGVKMPKSQLHLGSTEYWGKNYWVILDGTVKDWPVGEGDGENSKFEWKNVYGLFYGKDKDLEWAWNTKDFVYKFAPAELDLDESTNRRVKILNEGYWGHLPLENDSALDEFAEVAYNNIEEQLKNIDKNWNDKLSVFTYLGVIMYMLQIYNFFYSLKSLDEKFDFTNKINKAIKYLDDEKFINGWKNPDEVKEYIKKLPDTIKEILDKNSLGSDNFKKLKVTVPCNEGKNYVNMNVELRKGGRNAVKMSVEDFKQEMIHAYHEYAMEQEHKYKGELQLTPSPGNFVYNLCYKNKLNKKSKYASALYDDIWGGKYKFDSENVDAYGGIKMSKKGFPYIQCAAGGDWECPVCFFVYFDGNKFRGYVPLKGNAINRNEKHAFSGGGNEPDAKFVQKELGIDYEEADHMCDDIDYNVDACLEDFLERVEVKGTYKKRDYTKDEEEFKKYRKEKIDAENKRQAEAERIRELNKYENEPDVRSDSVLNENDGDYNIGPVYHCGDELSADKFSDIIWFSSRPLNHFGETHEYYISIKNPLHIPPVFSSWSDKLWGYVCDDDGKANCDVNDSRLTKIMPSIIWRVVQESDEELEVGDIPYIVANLVKRGVLDYDGVIIRNIGETPGGWEDVDDFCVFSPSQVRGLNSLDEATATGTGGLPGEFIVPFPMDKEDPSLDRTPGDTMGMHDRVGKSNLEEKRKKVVKNDKGEVVPEFCKKCGEKVGLYVQGEPIYKCSKCGEYYGTMPFKR